MALQIFNYIFAFLFLVSAGLQYNDPDPYLWMPIYLFGAVLCFLAARGRFYPKAYLAGMVLYGVYAVFLLFSKDGVVDWLNDHDAENIAQTMKATKPWIEDTREFFGLLILILALLINFLVARRRPAPKGSYRF
jgi:Ca2+/Na+ antiporter